MFSISDKIVNRMITGKIIPAEDKDLYGYGLHQGLIILANIITMVVIGIFFNMVIEGILFTASYAPLRSYAGGYHAKTPIRCYFISIVMIVAILCMIKFLAWNAPIVVIVTIISTAIIAILAPIEDKNKPLDKLEKSVYKKRTRIILAIELCALILVWLLEFRTIALSVFMALFMLSGMLLLGKLKNVFNFLFSADAED